jgi:hypothetical protein
VAEYLEDRFSDVRRERVPDLVARRQEFGVDFDRLGELRTEAWRK